VLVALGVTGCIGAYKSAEVLRGLQRQAVDVSVVMTTAATRFITPLTLQALSGRRVTVGALQDTGEPGVEHVDLARSAELLLVAPCTANTLGKFAGGIADDFLTTLFTAVRCPVLLAPAMNVRMYLSDAVQHNLEILRRRGIRQVGPDEGWLACREEGWGRMASPEEVVREALGLLDRRRTWRGVKVLVTAGPTREAIDPARFLSNPSTGRMGFALAEAAARRGGDVTLIAGPTHLLSSPDIHRVDVVTAGEMRDAVASRFDDCDVLLKAAAVADFRPVATSDLKVKKADVAPTLELQPNPDILRELSGRKGARFLVGFAAETGDLVAEGRRKLAEKSLDLVVANSINAVGSGFATETNEVTLIDAEGDVTALPLMSKREVAEAILDRIEPRLRRGEEER
jgi:phosphopantothenoylcysteine decarboxylase/phosphopantothenate--cysteine ligase